MNTFRRILIGSAVLATASSLAFANTTIDLVQFATGGGISTLTAPPNPNDSSTSVTGYSQTAAQAAAVAYNATFACPVGDTCSAGTASLYEIDLGVTAITSGSLQISNANGSNQNIYCFVVGLDVCSGSSATATNGIAIDGTISLAINDPNSNNVGFTNQPTFTIATSNVSGVGSGKANYIVVAPGTTSADLHGTAFSGTGGVDIPVADLYDSSSDPNWVADSANYSTSSVVFGLALTGSQQIGNAVSGVNAVNTSDTLNSGQVNVDYDYSFTEIETSTSTLPEPATMALMGSALLGLGLLGKRFKKQ